MKLKKHKKIETVLERIETVSERIETVSESKYSTELEQFVK